MPVSRSLGTTDGANSLDGRCEQGKIAPAVVEHQRQVWDLNCKENGSGGWFHGRELGKKVARCVEMRTARCRSIKWVYDQNYMKLSGPMLYQHRLEPFRQLVAAVFLSYMRRNVLCVKGLPSLAWTAGRMKQYRGASMMDDFWTISLWMLDFFNSFGVAVDLRFSCNFLHCNLLQAGELAKVSFGKQSSSERQTSIYISYQPMGKQMQSRDVQKVWSFKGRCMKLK